MIQPNASQQTSLIKKNKIETLKEQERELKRQQKEERDWARQQRTEELKAVMDDYKA